MGYYSLYLIAKTTPTVLYCSMTWSIDGIVNDKDGSMAWK
jgi:hypothetical protein